MGEQKRKLEEATFAGGCFWCIESAFSHVEGVVETVSGLTGGDEVNPSYEEAHMHDTGHKEAVRLKFDPDKVSYEELVEIFWHQIDPTDEGGQFIDRGPLYKTAIFFHNDKQREIAEGSKQHIDASGKFERPVVTEILPAKEFYPAQEYHQGYWKRYPGRYKLYRIGSGREGYIKETWGE